MSQPPPAKVKVFNYGIYTARDYWKQITKPHIDEYKSQRSPKNAVQVVQSLWGLVEWCADEQGKGWPIFIAELRVHHPEIFEWNWIRDIANSANHPRLGDQARTDQEDMCRQNPSSLSTMVKSRSSSILF